ncbi:MAG: type-F conjugative transfer system pilin assembly protein TrbC [Nitrospirae bacterium]|nr:type-F conjugative transfer system pilin assembly protein TrbC [Nitrospirota bacterium]MCL5021911.1 type-F conjugative transfer system pilin assembly protein TrbC [Nitrospirota bacterium]
MKEKFLHFPSPGLAVAVALVVAVTASPSFSGVGEEVDRAFQRSERYGDIDITNKNGAEMRKEAEKGFGNSQKRGKEVEGWKSRIKSDGNGNFYVDKGPSYKKAKKENFSIKKYLADDERIYVFISSSLPMTTLTNYADSLDRLRDPHIAMILRGCVESCSKIKPTVQFMKSIINPTEDVKRLAEFQIDPFLFRRHQIGQVPAIVFARGVSSVNPELSEGLDGNLQKPVESYVVYGDVSLEYALEKINGKVNNQRLSAIVRQLSSGYYGKQ